MILVFLVVSCSPGAGQGRRAAAPQRPMPKNVALSSWKRQSFSRSAVKAALQELSLGVLSQDEMGALRMFFTRLQVVYV